MSRAQLTSTVEQNTGGAVAPFVAGKNAVINGGMDIWQRGTSFSNSTSASTVYCADRWSFLRGAYTSGITASQQTSGLTNFQYNIRIQRTNGDTSTQPLYLQQGLESKESYRFAGQSAVLSFYARAGANYSATSNALGASIVYGTGTDNSIANGFTGYTVVATNPATLTTSWQKFTVTGLVSASATQVGIIFSETPTGTAGANDYFEITGAQLELGSVATPFSRAGGTLQGELALCQRYYERRTSAVGYSNMGFSGYVQSATSIVVGGAIAPKRTTPTIGYSNLSADSYGGAVAVSGTPSNYSTAASAGLVFTTSGKTAGQAVNLIDSGSNTGYIEFIAEL